MGMADAGVFAASPARTLNGGQASLIALTAGGRAGGHCEVKQALFRHQSREADRYAEVAR